jgi:hypothetical protein
VTCIAQRFEKAMAKRSGASAYTVATCCCRSCESSLSESADEAGKPWESPLRERLASPQTQRV